MMRVLLLALFISPTPHLIIIPCSPTYTSASKLSSAKTFSPLINPFGKPFANLRVGCISTAL